jgi:hypothetical protein
LGVLIIAVVGAGAASTRLTRHYRFEYFDEDGKPAGIGYQTRQVKADGSWRNVTTLPDGTTRPSSGKMTRPPTTEVDDGTFPEHMGYKCFIAKDPTFDMWLNRDLQDELKSELRYENGNIRYKKYAIDITKD